MPGPELAYVSVYVSVDSVTDAGAVFVSERFGCEAAFAHSLSNKLSRKSRMPFVEGFFEIGRSGWY
jgi:hypothetical protein